MYIFKNAMRNILRAKGRNFLIGLIAFVIATSSCIALSIKSSATKAENSAKDNLSITASISLNRNKIMEKAQAEGKDQKEAMKEYSSLGLDKLQEYSKAKSVSDFYYSVTSSVNGVGFDPVDDTSSSEESSDSGSKSNKPPGDMVARGNGSQGKFSIVGYSSNNAMTSFVNGTSKISSGAMFSENESNMQCIISKELASLNSLKEGDTITISNPNNEDETYTLTISGIYETTEDTNSDMKFSSSSDPSNKIYTSYSSLKTILDSSSENATVSTNSNGEETTTALRNQVKGTYVFKDVDSFESFKNEVKTMGLEDYYSVESANVNDYEQSIVPLKNLSNFVNVFFVVVLAIGGLILVVLNIFTIRERKYEVGVLTAIGMKKWKVLIQYISEVFIVMFTSIVIGTAAGAIASPKIADNLLSTQIVAQQEQKQSVESNFGRGQEGKPSSHKTSKSTVEYIDSINASVDINVIGELLGIGIILTICSSSVATIYILRYEPLKILSNRG